MKKLLTSLLLYAIIIGTNLTAFNLSSLSEQEQLDLALELSLNEHDLHDLKEEEQIELAIHLAKTIKHHIVAPAPHGLQNKTGRCWFNATLQCFLQVPFYQHWDGDSILLKSYNSVAKNPSNKKHVDTLFSHVIQEYFDGKTGGQSISNFVIPFSSIIPDATTIKLKIPQDNSLNTLDDCLTSTIGIDKRSLAKNSIIIVDLGRWVTTTHYGKKYAIVTQDTTQTPVSFPLELKIDTQTYSLSSAILVDSGHALSVIKHGKHWHLCDDSIIQKHSDDSVIQTLAHHGHIEYSKMLMGTPWTLSHDKITRYHKDGSYTYIKPGCRGIHSVFVPQTLFYIKK